MPTPRNHSRAAMRALPVGDKRTRPATDARERALANSIAATEARKRAEHWVDWPAVIKRFKADMAKRAAEEGIA